MLLIGNTNLQQLDANPIVGHLVGFVTLTLPVFLYSYLTEKSSWKGTIGKKLLGLSVVVEKDGVGTSPQLSHLLSVYVLTPNKLAASLIFKYFFIKKPYTSFKQQS